jgi:hypothetical protein
MSPTCNPRPATSIAGRFVFTACAVEAAVFSARQAVPQQLLAKMLSRAAQPDGEVISREARILRSTRGIPSIEIDALDQFAVVYRRSVLSVHRHLLSPILAGAAMSLSSVSVISNSLWLRKLRLG